ncbi:MAG: SixA phosphatase family protein [Anaerolineaceae bacterium]|jgi:phosphohistidine phosphatase
MTKTLLLMRHAKSSWKDKTIPDIKRPLKKRGEEAAAQVGETLKKHELTPQLILTSPAKRAHATAEIVAKKSGYKGDVEVVDEFYMAEPAVFFQKLMTLDEKYDRVMVVAHNPGLEALLQILDGQINSLPTGALADIKLDVQTWADIGLTAGGTVIAFWDPENDPKRKKKDKK